MLGGQNLAGAPGPLGAGCTTQRNPAGSPLQDDTGGEMVGSCDQRIRSRASWSKLWPFPFSTTFGPLFYLLEPQTRCAVSGEITLGAGLVQISCVAWAGSLDLSGPQLPFL